MQPLVALLCEDLLRSLPTSISAIEIAVKADNYGVGLFSGYVLIGIIEIEVELFRHRNQVVHGFGLNGHQSNLTVNEKIVRELRKHLAF